MSQTRGKAVSAVRPEAPPKDQPPVAGKITAALVSEAVTALEKTHEATNRSKTDIVNKSLILYGFISSELRAGGELILKRPNGESHIIQLL